MAQVPRKMDNDVSIMNDKSMLERLHRTMAVNLSISQNYQTTKYILCIKRRKEHGIRYPIFLATQRKRVGIRISFDPFLGSVIKWIYFNVRRNRGWFYGLS